MDKAVTRMRLNIGHNFCLLDGELYCCEDDSMIASKNVEISISSSGELMAYYDRIEYDLNLYSGCYSTIIMQFLRAL